MPAEQTELFIGLVSPVGTDIGMVADEIATELAEYRYSADVLRLSNYLAELPDVQDFGNLKFDEYLWEAMSAGDALREKWGGDALASIAITDIAATREEKSSGVIEIQPSDGDSQSLPANLDRHAFVLRSIKTQDELETLRAVYGRRFFLVAAYSPDDKREDYLANEIQRSRKTKDRSEWVHQPEDLISRDFKEETAGGQDVRGTFHQADFFIRAVDRDTARADIARMLEILFGAPFRTPTRDEYGQFQAAGAALRSAEPGRQVGAAITDGNGSLVALGCNEVPRVGGGSHWEDQGKGNREFEVSSKDANREHQEQIATRLAQGLIAEIERAIGDNEDLTKQFAPARHILQEGLEGSLLVHGLVDLTEFGRAVHAEMAAVLDAAQRGVPIHGTTLYSTTFPCHTCARHIIGAGIERVVFIEPYPKSKASPLHDDAIAIAQSDPGGRVAFEPFVGVAPGRYLELFDADARERQGHTARKDTEGLIQDFEKKTARPVFTDLEPTDLRPVVPTYRLREQIALRRYIDKTKGSNEKKKEVENGEL